MKIKTVFFCGLITFFCSMFGPLLAQPRIELPSEQDIEKYLQDIKSARESRQSGNNTQALIEYLSALEIAERNKHHVTVASILFLLGEVYESARKYQQALKHYELATLALSMEDSRVADTVQNILADYQLPHSTGKSYFQALQKGEPVSTDLYRGTLPPLDKLLSQPEQASSQIAAVSLLNAANLYLRQGQIPQAERLYRDALEIVNVHDQSLKIHIETNLAWAAIKQGQYAQAQQMLLQLITNPNVKSSALSFRKTYLALGISQHLLGDFEHAVQNLQLAAKLYEESADRPGYARALAHLQTALSKGDCKNISETGYRFALDLADTQEDTDSALHSLRQLAACSRSLGDLESAREYYQRYLHLLEAEGDKWATDQGRVSLMEQHDVVLQDYIGVELDLALQNGEFSFLRTVIERVRERSLNRLQFSRMTDTSTPAGSLELEYFLAKAGRLHTLEKFDRLNRDYDNNSPVQMLFPGTEDGRATISEIYKISDEHPCTKGIGSTICPVFVEYYLLDDRGVVLYSSPGRAIQGAILPFGENLLKTKIRTLRRALGISQEERGAVIVPSSKQAADVGQDASWRLLAAGLYQLLVEPIADSLAKGSGKQFVIVPHRSLWLLPFAILKKEQGDFFGDRYPLTYATSAASWHWLSSRARPSVDAHKAWIVGNPDMPAKLNACGTQVELKPLPGAEDEAREIARLFESEKMDLFIGPAADRLRLEAWHKDATVIHLASHGIVCHEKPLKSFVWLSPLNQGEVIQDVVTPNRLSFEDERRPVTLTHNQGLTLSQLEVKNQDLNFPGKLEAQTIAERFKLQTTDLITLSACQTGLGEFMGHGSIGFSRALLAAGARSLLVSLWRVDDNATKALMVSFYKAYLSHRNKALALQQAIKKTRIDYPHPRFWAAFTLVGMAE